jgi:hypothetical protein
MKKFALYTFIVLLSVFSGIILTAQILGFLGLYYPIPVFIVSLFFSVIFGYFLHRYAFPFLENFLSRSDRPSLPRWTVLVLQIAALAIFVIVLFLPLLLWPYTGINHELNWDTGFYHLPKAAQMIVSHSSWDLTIPYGEYPYGFESLLAFSLLISSGGYLIGAVHALILLFFTLVLYFLSARYSKLPTPVLFFLSVFIIASYDIIRLESLNPFVIFRVLAFTIGKNDFFLATAMLALILFSPVDPHQPAYEITGLALTSLLVITTKPNGFLLVAFVWLYALVLYLRAYRRQSIHHLELWIAAIVIQLVGLLWMVRNWVVQGTLFSADSFSLQKLSIFNNLSNPKFLHALGLLPLIIAILALATLLMNLFARPRNFSLFAAFLFLILSFALTPAVLYFGSSDSEAVIFWRLGFYLIAFLVPILFWIFDRPLYFLFTHTQLHLALAVNLMLAGVAILTAVTSCYQNASRLQLDPANTLVLRDQYTHSVGVDGYFSAYDYVRKNVNHSVVWIDNGLPFYLFGENLTNSITRSQPADYQVFLQTNWNGRSGYPPSLDTPDWTSQWKLVYEDSEGRVYQRSSLGN